MIMVKVGMFLEGVSNEKGTVCYVYLSMLSLTHELEALTLLKLNVYMHM
jgi:hypothetical protein